MHVPDALSIELNNYFEWFSRGNSSWVLQHGVHKILKALVGLLIFLLQVHALDVVDDMTVKQLAQFLIGNTEQFEE